MRLRRRSVCPGPREHPRQWRRRRQRRGANHRRCRGQRRQRGAAGNNGGAGPGTGNLGGASGDAGPAGGGAADTQPATPGGATPRPKRFIVLGDSIAACSNVGRRDGADCSIKKLYDHLKATYAPDLVYDNQAVAAAIAADVPGKQLATVTPGPGHALVLIYVGGNDLAKHMFVLDAAAEQGLKTDLPKVLAAWEQIFGFFADKTRFPDGYTMLMSSQYNPFDNCMAAPYFLTPKKNDLLAQFNGALKDLATQKSALFTDQFTPFLGHGHHYRIASCPFYMNQATAFMDDLIHPNPAGHDNLYQQWRRTLDAAYRAP